MDTTLIAIIAGCAGGGLVLILLVVCCICLYKRKVRRDKALGLYPHYGRSSLRSLRSSQSKLDDYIDGRHHMNNQGPLPRSISEEIEMAREAELAEAERAKPKAKQAKPQVKAESKTMGSRQVLSTGRKEPTTTRSSEDGKRYGALKVLSNKSGSQESLESISSLTCTSEKPCSSMTSGGRHSSLEELASMLDKPEPRPVSFYSPPKRLNEAQSVPKRREEQKPRLREEKSQNPEIRKPDVQLRNHQDIPTAALYAPQTRGSLNPNVLTQHAPPRPPKSGPVARPRGRQVQSVQLTSAGETDIDDYTPRTVPNKNKAITVTNL